MNKQQLANRIWESANKMRSKIEANEYKDYILGFIFYKFLSDKEVRFLKSEGATDEHIKYLDEIDTGNVKHIQRNIGYFISYDNLFSTWLSKGSDFDVSNVRDALSAFSRLIDPNFKKVFDGIFDTLQTGLSKLGESAASQTKAVRELIHLIKDIPMNGNQDYDVLGFVYEYLISNFAANAGKKAGEFYTPHEVALLMSDIVANHLHHRKKIQIYDPTSGSGSLLINIGRSVGKHIHNVDNIKYYAQELKQNTYNLTRMNLVMRGILPSNITTRNGDTLEEDWPYFEENDPVGTYDPLYVDAVVSNPPYSQHWSPEDKETDPRYARFGIAPRTKADYAFLLHALYHVKPDGIMTIVLPHGVLFRGEEGEIRKNLVENNHIDAIIGLPANIFFGTGIPTIIMVLKQKRSNTDVLIIDASKHFIKEGTTNKLQASDIKRIADTVANRKEITKFSREISRDEIRANEYNLNIPRYVDSSEEAETWDIYASMFGGIPTKELAQLQKYWWTFPSLQKALFEEKTSEHVILKVENIEDMINNHPDIAAFKNSFTSKFADYGNLLSQQLIDNMSVLDILQVRETLSEDIFTRLKSVPLIDAYDVYQLFSDQWVEIEEDLEMIQTEGVATIKKVEPNIITRKRSGQDIEVQDGWKGRILPFELVQKVFLTEEFDSLREEEDRLAVILSEQQDIFDSLSEEDKMDLNDVLNNANTAFLSGALNRAVNELLKNAEEKYPEGSIEKKLVDTKALVDEERVVKRSIKTKAGELHALTKRTIENLSNEQMYDLLHKKWIESLLVQIQQMPQAIINVLIEKIQKLVEKYSTTFSDLEDEIKSTEKSLLTMLDQLTGSETDMQGVTALKNVLRGSEND